MPFNLLGFPCGFFHIQGGRRLVPLFSSRSSSSDGRPDAYRFSLLQTTQIKYLKTKIKIQE